MAKLGYKRGLAQPFVESFAKKGISANLAYKALQEQGIGYRRTDFLVDYRAATGALKKADVLKYVPKKYIPTEAHVEERAWLMKRKYSIVFEVKGISISNNEPLSRYVTVSTDVLKSLGSMQDSLRANIHDMPGVYDMKVLSFIPEKIYKRAESIPAPWE
jgi:hypothetical protein